MQTRRSLLATGGSTVAAMVAGCLSPPDAGRIGDDLQYYRWLGESTAKHPTPSGFDRRYTTWEYDSARRMVVREWSPSAFTSNENVSDEISTVLPADEVTMGVGASVATIDAPAIDTYLNLDSVNVELAIGSFDVDEIRSMLPVDAEYREDHEGYELYAMDHVESDDPRYHLLEAGAALGDGRLLVAKSALTGESIEYLKLLLDTYAGSEDRYFDTDDTVAGFVSLLGGGHFVSVFRFPSTYSVGAVLELGDDVTSKRIVHAHESRDDAKNARGRVADAIEQVHGTDEAVSPELERANELLQPYTEVEVSTIGQFLVFEGELPTAELRAVDLGLGVPMREKVHSGPL